MSIKTINKAFAAAEHPILLQSPAQLEKAGQIWEQREILGIDTEFVRERTYRADLGLVQISDGETAWLFDPIAVPEFEALARMLANPGSIKLLHSGSEDLEVMLHAVGVIPDPLVDIQIACAMLGQPLQLGYHHAVKWLFDVDIAKDQTRSNWCKRPLHDRQLRYAALDVVLLPEMLRQLRKRLVEAGRWSWLEEDVARMQRNAQRPVDPDTVYFRFPRTGSMDDETLRALKYLARWREHTAIDRNRARGFVVSDAALLDMARQRPSTEKEVASIEGLHPVAVSRYSKKWLALLSEAAADKTRVAKAEPLTRGQQKQLKIMRKTIQSRSAELAIDPALLASRRELERLIRALSDGRELPERFLGWRKPVITDELLRDFG